jgi:hypothetical protein
MAACQPTEQAGTVIAKVGIGANLVIRLSGIERRERAVSGHSQWRAGPRC